MRSSNMGPQGIKYNTKQMLNQSKRNSTGINPLKDETFQTQNYRSLDVMEEIKESVQDNNEFQKFESRNPDESDCDISADEFSDCDEKNHVNRVQYRDSLMRSSNPRNSVVVS